MNSSRFIEALLQEPLAGGQVRCDTCGRRCVIGEGQTGWCGTREVRNGRLYARTYARVSSLSANPIEKKPLYHFYPGSTALTAGGWGCNFACPWCQNWEISKNPSGGGRFLTAGDFVQQAHRRGCRGTSISFNEPTLSLEWALEAFRAARKSAPPLYNTLVTNGYMTPEALRCLAEAGLDALNIDLKGDQAVYERYCGAEAGRVWESCRLSRELGLHLEITTLAIPGVNDGSGQLHSIADRIVRELGRGTPWHVTAYCPAYRFDAPPTPPATLRSAHRIGKESGLDFVYIGNIESLAAHTYCPSCRSLLIERLGFNVLRCEVTASGACPRCAARIPGAGWSWQRT